MKKLIISGAIILAAVGIAWLIAIGGWFFLNILVILAVILIALGLFLLKISSGCERGSDCEVSRMRRRCVPL